MANLYQLQAGATEAVVSDYAADGAEVRIPLDRSLSPAANAERYYQRYQKQKRAAAELERQVEMAEMELQYIEGLMSSIELCDDVNGLMEIRSEKERQGLMPQRNSGKSDSRRTPVGSFGTDTVAYVGRVDRLGWPQQSAKRLPHLAAGEPERHLAAHAKNSGLPRHFATDQWRWRTFRECLTGSSRGGGILFPSPQLKQRAG